GRTAVGSDGDHDRPARRAQRCPAVGAAVLRAQGADLQHPDLRQPAAVRAGHAAPGRVRAVRPAAGHLAGDDPRGPRDAARRPYADARGLGAAVPGLAQGAGRADRPAAAAAGQPGRLHRVRLPVDHDLPAGQQPRRARRAGSRPAAAGPRRLPLRRLRAGSARV
ncbi:MAG: Redox-sensitive transcriptional activator SoxR, partial [uncultured Corynebacteriales bacterium]